MFLISLHIDLTMNCQRNINSTLPTQLPHKFSYIVAILGHNHFESPNMYLPTSQNVSGFADGCPDIEMVFGGESNSLATWSSSTLVFITIQHIKYVSVNINKINFINVYLFGYECTLTSIAESIWI
jgi:hypothetical protein